MTEENEVSPVNEIHLGFECTERQRKVLVAFVRQRGSTMAHEIRQWIDSLEPHLYTPLDAEGNPVDT